MFSLFRKRRIKRYTKEALVYIRQNYIAPYQPSEIRYSLSGGSPIKPQSQENVIDERHDNREINVSPRDIECSLPKKSKNEDSYDASKVTQLLRNYSTASDFNEMLRELEENVNQTFVDRLLHYISEKGVRDSEVYKAAQVDKRLFSKMVSNREYKPSKDTAIALALALELALDEANDLLSRAGYTFSHSNKRDIIIEFFFREKIYNLMDANDVLYRLNQKLIGRL